MATYQLPTTYVNTNNNNNNNYYYNIKVPFKRGGFLFLMLSLINIGLNKFIFLFFVFWIFGICQWVLNDAVSGDACNANLSGIVSNSRREREIQRRNRIISMVAHALESKASVSLSLFLRFRYRTPSLFSLPRFSIRQNPLYFSVFHHNLPIFFFIFFPWFFFKNNFFIIGLFSF